MGEGRASVIERRERRTIEKIARRVVGEVDMAFDGDRNLREEGQKPFIGNSSYRARIPRA